MAFVSFAKNGSIYILYIDLDGEVPLLDYFNYPVKVLGTLDDTGQKTVDAKGHTCNFQNI